MNLIEQAQKINTEADQKKFFVDVAAAVEGLKKKPMGISQRPIVKQAKGVKDKMVRNTETK